MKFITVALACVGAAYLIMMYFGSLFKQVAFTTQVTGPVSVAACALAAFGVLAIAKLSWK